MTPVCAFTNCLTAETPPPPTAHTHTHSSTASSFSYADLLMKSSGPEDHIAPSGSHFSCSISDVSAESGQIAQRLLLFFHLFLLLSVDAGFTLRPALSVVTLFHVFSEGDPPPTSSPSFTLPDSAPSHSAFTAATDVKTCLRQCSLLRKKAFFIWIIMGLLGLEKYPAFVVFKIPPPPSDKWLTFVLI